MAAPVRYSFALDAIRDQDIIRWLELQPNTSAAIRSALKSHVSKPSHLDLLRKMDEVLNAVNTLRFAGPVVANGDENQPEPAKAASGLDTMVGKFKDPKVKNNS